MQTVVGTGHRIKDRSKKTALSINDADLSGHSWVFGTTRVVKPDLSRIFWNSLSIRDTAQSSLTRKAMLNFSAK
jgi:hypothetical protein